MARIVMHLNSFVVNNILKTKLCSLLEICVLIGIVYGPYKQK